MYRCWRQKYESYPLISHMWLK